MLPFTRDPATMPIPKIVSDLIKRFERHGADYAERFKETQLRRDFLDPFFGALGWDVSNTAGNAEAYRDVIHEDSIKVGGGTKAPDYCFRIGGTRKFFVEAKKPAVKVKTDRISAYQLRRYGWSAKLPLCILTNFKEFAVYDCRWKPAENDNASVARVKYLQYTDFAEGWEEIAGIFSPGAIQRGAFDKYAESSRKKRGTEEVDDAFLAEIETWRDILARNLALRNELSVRSLNYAVQKTIDRLVFLRICEDRGIEDYGRLKALLNGPKVYPRLKELFEAADDRYNSGLFHFHAEKNRAESPDEWTLSLVIDDTPLKEIIRKLYYPKSPYEFSVLPADILGQVYERFLGKVIRLTAGGAAKVEEKPEVRKAGGVYYTPTYIVRYIVENTVGTLLEEASVKQPGRKDRKLGRSLRVLDPACGSGSFLLEAYQFLLDWYLAWYLGNAPKKIAKVASPPIRQDAKGIWRLTTAERKRILLDHIYGVDIDPQAVEVTKLSLLLKVLEGETRETLYRQLFAKERALPDLAENIKCGNSLIGSDFYRDRQLDLFDEEELLRINAFDWEVEFRRIMKEGGFDAVIGNPPYIFTREIFTQEERRFFTSSYDMNFEKQNSFMLFMEKTLSLLKPNGMSSFIVPNSWLTIESAKYLRQEYIKHLITIIDLNFQVFERVSLEPSIFIIRHNQNSPLIHTSRVANREEFPKRAISPTSTSSLRPPNYRIVFSASQTIETFIEQLTERTSPIGDRFDVKSGLQAYERGKGRPPQSRSDVENHVYDRSEKEDENTLKYLQGGDVSRWTLNWSGAWMKYGRWLAQPREIGLFTRPRVLIREITGNLPYAINAAYTEDVFLNNKSILNVLSSNDDYKSLKILTAILNSRLMSLYYKERAVKSARRIFPKIVIRNLREFPFPNEIAPQNAEKALVLVDKRVRLALDLNKVPTKSTHQKTVLNRQIAATDREIDRLVYELYGLTDQEIAIVEEATSR